MKTTGHHKWKESPYEKLLFMNAMQKHPESEPAGGNFARHPVKPVKFYCAAPRAESVALAGDFNHWHPLPMQQRVDGWWFAQVELRHGHHRYRFLVDGNPVLDPQAPGITRDDHNEQVSVLAVS
jgi:1,4-alpha-glucan branching enzyme